MKNNKKLGFSVLVLVVVMLTVGMYYILEEVKEENEKRLQYNIDQRLKNLEKSRKNKGFKYNYYDNLREKCKLKDSYNCCLASADRMEELNIKAFGKGKCEEGFKKNTLKCVDSYSWCEKTEFSRNKTKGETMSVSNLIKSNITEEEYVEVNGLIGQCIKLKVSSDYEGLPGGCRLYDKNNKVSAISTDASFVTMENEDEVTVKGKVRYCGGKKHDKYICYLYDAKILNNSNESKKIENKKTNPFHR